MMYTPNRWQLIPLLLAIVFPLYTAAADDVDAETVIKDWVAAANVVRTVKIKLEGNRFVPTAPEPGGLPPGNRDEGVTIPTTVEFWFTRDGNKERFRRSGLEPASRGLVFVDFTCVHIDGVEKELRPGSAKSDGRLETDQFTIRNSAGFSDPSLSGIRMLLNLTLSGSAFFGNDQFLVVPDAEILIDGVQCLSMESQNGRGMRIWFERSSPNRMLRIEKGLTETERFGYHEYRLTYGNDDVEPHESAVREPTSVESIRYGADGRLAMIVKANVTSYEVNPEIPDDMFELKPPPGAYLADRSRDPPEFFIQLADGTARKLTREERLVNNFYRLSATVKGSRVEGKIPPNALSGPDGPDNLRSILITLTLGGLTVGVVYFLWSRRTASSRIS